MTYEIDFKPSAVKDVKALPVLRESGLAHDFAFPFLEWILEG